MDTVVTSSAIPRHFRDLFISFYGAGVKQRRDGLALGWEAALQRTTRLGAAMIRGLSIVANKVSFNYISKSDLQGWQILYADSDAVKSRSVLYAALSVGAYWAIRNVGSDWRVTGAAVALASGPAAIGGFGIWGLEMGARAMYTAIQTGSFETLAKGAGWALAGFALIENYDIFFSRTLLDYFVIDRVCPQTRTWERATPQLNRVDNNPKGDGAELD